MAGKICEMLQLCGQLAAAVAAVLEDPSHEHSKDVQHLVRPPLNVCLLLDVYLHAVAQVRLLPKARHTRPSPVWERCCCTGTRAS